MSFLAPLYAAALAAIALPIIFHLIRRTPQKRQEFSSLMFLAPSPPRITRRSRLNNILLLILRGAALALLAFAFARPFFYREQDVAMSAASGERIAIMIDASASMRRGDLWDQAKAQVERVIGELSPGDEVSLSFFDRNVRAAMTFDEWNETELSRRVAILRARLNEASPTWLATNLGQSLAIVARDLAETRGNTKEQASVDKSRRRVVLISDLQQGAHVEALQGHEWPENVVLDVRNVSPGKQSNASIQVVHDGTDTPQPGNDEQVRVRVTNQAGSTREQFTVAWVNERGPIAGVEPQKVYVPPGRSLVIRLAWPAQDQAADRIALSGDDSDFDNTLFVVRPRQETVRVVYIGADAADDPKGLSYYTRSALSDTPARKVELVQRLLTDEVTDTELAGARLVVVAGTVRDDIVPRVRSFTETGGIVLFVLTDASSGSSAAKMLGMDALNTSEAKVRDFALVGRVELDHPLFSAFSDARFADFTKIHFWKHRSVKLPSGSDAHVIARFDDGDPFLIEKLVGKAGGRVIVATAGWQPADSQLALSTKFVPLIGGLLRQRESSSGSIASEATVGDVVSNALADHPGIYEVAVNDVKTPIAVNLSPDESRTSPLAPADLEKWGAKLGGGELQHATAAVDARVAHHRQLKMAELENRQKLWRWLIVCALGFIAAETILAATLTRRPTVSAEVTEVTA